MTNQTRTDLEKLQELANGEPWQMIMWIPTDKLFPHPDNPRQELGDLEELTESIKARGVMQNLTVIANPDDTNTYLAWLDGKGEGKVKVSKAYRDHMIVHCFKKDYTVIIGHRRLAAAVAAGITKLPCVVVEMDYPTQIATMLTENIQRADLTVYEQARSFKQLTIDCGMSAADIADRTGFSKSTVRRRLKIAELDEETLKQVSGRQISLTDFDKLDAIADPKLKNKALLDIGTSKFENSVNNAVFEEKKQKWIAECEAALKCAGFSKISNASNYQRCDGFYEAPAIELLKKLLTKGAKYYLIDQWGYFNIYKERDDEKEVDTEKFDRERCAKLLEEAFERAFERRFNFVKYLGHKCNHPTAIVWMNLARLCYECGYRYDQDTFAELCGFDSNTGLRTFNDCTGDVLAPFRYVLYTIYAATGDGPESIAYCNLAWRINYGEFTENKDLEKLYEMLGLFGYEMSDEEQELLDGTSEFYYGNKKEDE